jgi:Tfp pilus assembly protein PilO
MTRSAWLKYLWTWLLPALGLLANGLWLFGLRSVVLGSGAKAVAQVQAKERQVKELEQTLRQLAATQERLSQVRQQLSRLRLEEMGSMRQNLVPFLAEVGERARKVGLFPQRIAYAAREEKKSRLVHFSATFELSGSYEQLRQYMSELENVPQFLVIERLGLRGEEVARSTDISMQMVVGTYFSDLDRQLLQKLGVQEEGEHAAF